MERILQQFLHSPAHRDFSYLIGIQALNQAFKEYEDRPKYRRLVISFEKGENPDDAYSSVPYEKGANFLLYIGKMDLYLEATHCWQDFFREDFRRVGYLLTLRQGLCFHF